MSGVCSGGCNERARGEADFPAKREPWRCKLFRCSSCKRFVPWCCGAADERPHDCDECASKARRSAA